MNKTINLTNLLCWMLRDAESEGKKENKINKMMTHNCQIYDRKWS